MRLSQAENCVPAVPDLSQILVSQEVMLWICECCSSALQVLGQQLASALRRAKVNSLWPGGCSETEAEACKTAGELGEMP